MIYGYVLSRFFAEVGMNGAQALVEMLKVYLNAVSETEVDQLTPVYTWLRAAEKLGKGQND